MQLLDSSENLVETILKLFRLFSKSYKKNVLEPFQFSSGTFETIEKVSNELQNCFRLFELFVKLKKFTSIHNCLELSNCSQTKTYRKSSRTFAIVKKVTNVLKISSADSSGFFQTFQIIHEV